MTTNNQSGGEVKRAAGMTNGPARRPIGLAPEARDGKSHPGHQIIKLAHRAEYYTYKYYIYPNNIEKYLRIKF